MTTQWLKEGKPDLRGAKERKLKEAHQRAQEQARARRRAAAPRVGVVRLSNTDSLRTAMAVRRRVLGKLTEVAAADVEPRLRGTMVANVKMQLDRIDRQIHAIRRRERAVEEERRARRDECPNRRRRRRAEMKERSIHIRRDFMYPAKSGGFDPYNPAGFPLFCPPAATVSIGGADTSLVADAPADAPALALTL